MVNNEYLIREGEYKRDGTTYELISGDTPSEFVAEVNANGWTIVSLSVTATPGQTSQVYDHFTWFAVYHA